MVAVGESWIWVADLDQKPRLDVRRPGWLGDSVGQRVMRGGGAAPVVVRLRIRGVGWLSGAVVWWLRWGSGRGGG